MRELILSRLRDEEIKNNFIILYACESGSRIWGFASKDSDWDVRYIYIRPVDWYLSIERLHNFKTRPDTIENEMDSNDIDMRGWDLSKALFLLYSNNCPLLEWLQSSVIYIDRPKFVEQLISLSTKYWSERRAIYHYYHMTNNNVKDYLTNKKTVWTKKYIYILRTLLACLWIEVFKTCPPPSIFNLMVTLKLPINVVHEIYDLLSRKMNGEELGKAPFNPILNEFIFEQINRIRSNILPSLTNIDVDGNPKMLEEINTVFHNYVGRRDETV